MAEGRRRIREPVHLLIIEDDGAYVALVRTMLDHGAWPRFDAEDVDSLERATERLADRPFDVVLLDLGLRDADGTQALHSIVNAFPQIPVVILSGRDDLDLALEAVQDGAQDFLVKSSVTPDILGRALCYAIERKDADLETRRLALRDSLTQLPNRQLLAEQLGVALHRAKRARRVLGVFFIDLDQFKQVNDTLGHAAGDFVLRQVAHRLTTSLRASDTLARLSGDEFVAIVEVNRRSDLAVKAETIQHQFHRPFTVDGEDLFLTASIGVSSYPADGADTATLIRNADRAMYRAKAEGRDTHRLYSARHHAGGNGRSVKVRAGLRHAIERAELLLHFQPLVRLQDEGVDGIEALVRWRHPALGLIGPADFIPMAEESGLILSLERWVLEAALQAAGSLPVKKPLKVAVNLSTRHFDQTALTAELRAVTRTTKYDPKFLELELTESGIMHHPKRVLRHLKAFRRLGVRVAVDDFGTGYSCLSLMNRFPLHAVKIDRSFVSDCATNPTSEALVAAIIQMGHALGLEVTAEGVETEEQLAVLRAHGCDRAQGWLFSPPVSAAELPEVLGRLRHVG